MCLLHEVYQIVTEREGITKRNIEVNQEVVAIAKDADYKKLMEDKEYLSTLLFSATYVGELEGFATGLKYGIQLMVKCFE